MPDDLGIPLLRGSERKDFKRCPQRWWWGWRDGLKSTKQKTPLWFGTGIHLAFEHWYVPGTKRGRDLRETWSEYCEGVDELVRVQIANEELPGEYQQVVVKAEGVGLEMLDNYLDKYGNDDQWEILSPEQTFSVRIPRDLYAKDMTPAVRFLGTFDIVARDLSTGLIWLWDHKTAKSIKTNHLPLDDQAGGYWAVADTTLRKQGIIGEKERINGILYNFLMKSPPDTRPLNADGLATNKPVKHHYVETILEHEAAGHRQQDALEEWMNGRGAEREKELKKMKLPDLVDEAADVGLTVLGDVSLQQPSPRLHREPVYRTSAERRRQIARIADEVRSMNAMRDGTLPLYKTPTTNCTWDCDFYDLCLADEQGGDVELLKQVAFRVEDPYAAHRGPDRRGEF